MIRLFVALTFTLTFTLIASLPARADDTLDGVRTLLDTGDLTGLEQELAGISDPTTLRAVNTRLFETTHPDRLAVIHRWTEEMPASPYAATAEAWAALKTLEMWSGPSRRYELDQNNALVDTFRAARADALDAVDKALDLSEMAYLPALDAWMRAREIEPDWDGFGPVADSMLELAADQASAQIIVRAGVAKSPAAAQQAVGLCLQLSELIDEYDADACMIGAVTNQYLGDELENAVFDLVEETDDPRFAAARLEALLHWKRKDPAKVETWIELHRKLLGPDTDLAEWDQQAWTIFRFGDRPEYRDEAVPRLIAEIDTRLADDPLNHKLLRLSASLLLASYEKGKDKADLVAARAAWEGLLAYAETDPMTWELGGNLIRADHDPSDIATERLFRENAIAYSEQSLNNILVHFYYMSLAREAADARLAAGDHAAPDPTHVLEDLKCPMLRAARTSSALCRVDGAGVDLCDPEKPLFAPVPGVLKDGAAGSCPEVAEASLSALTYKAIPFTEIGNPWDGAED